MPKIAENRLIVAFMVHKKAEKPLKAKVKTQFGKEVKMSWNLFEKIINAFKPNSESQQPSEAPDQSQQWPESSSEQSLQEGSSQQQSCPENSTEQPEDSQEPSPSYQETPSAPQQSERQQQQE